MNLPKDTDGWAKSKNFDFAGRSVSTSGMKADGSLRGRVASFSQEILVCFEIDPY